MTSRDQLHVVMLPWSAFGHMMPFYQLSIALAKAGVRVSYIQTPNNIQRLPRIPPSLTSMIDFVEIPMQPGLLPEGCEATVDIPIEKMQDLETAYDLLQHPFKKFVLENSPDWIVVDKTPYWAVDIAREQKIPVFFFLTFSVVAASFLGPPEFLVGEGQKKVRATFESFMSPPHWITIPSTIAFKKHEAFFTHGALYGSNDTTRLTDADRIAKILSGSQFIAARSCLEFEGEYFKLYEQVLKKPVIPLGLLPPETKPQKMEDSNIFQWLDDQKPKSVIYSGFGSECKLSREEVFEIAHGLELSNLPFFWALRKPAWAIDESHTLPSVLLPFMYDQPLNARFLVEKGLAVEIERNEDGWFSRDDIAKSLRLTMVSEEGEGVRARARETAAVFGNHDMHRDYIARFVEYLQNGVSK
ncbi:hypothetical protein ACFE04_016875 [Oxalis oulophora]